MNVFQQIVEWAKERPLWQQEAIKMIISNSELCESDIEELTRLCKVENGVIDAPMPDSSEESAALLPSESEGVYALLGISDIVNVNALAEGARIEFGQTGITIIYGDNASGKSGYCRILKNVCRSRNPEEVLPNVHLQSNTVPSAKVIFALNREEPTSLSWEKGNPPSLPAISVFDAKCADAYVESETDVAYRPFGLDIFDRLAGVCDSIRDTFSAEIEELEQSLIDLSEGFSEDTQAGQLILHLSAETKVDDIQKLTTISDEEEKEAISLQRKIALLEEHEPARRKNALIALKDRITKLSEHISKVDSSLSVDNVEKLKGLVGNLASANDAAKLAAEGAFESELPGVGSETWKKLWEAARSYSQNDAYPEESFPVIRDESKCVLCQQPLSQVSKERLTSFEKFVKMEAQKRAETAGKALADALETFEKSQVLPLDWENIRKNLEHDTKVVSSLDSFFDAAQKRKDAILQALQDEKWEKVPDSPASPSDSLKTQEKSLQEEIDSLQNAASSTDLPSLKAALKDFTERNELKTLERSVYQQIENMKKIKKLQNCKRKTSTQSITLESGNLTQEAVTRPLCLAFETEVHNLKVPVKVAFEESGSRKGVAFHKITLSAQNGDRCSLKNIASESEYRCLALAGFFAELVTAEHKSAIVFDDPVCSLDHTRREAITKRIIQEAHDRQVIVFTHDIVFVMLLKHLIEKEKGTLPVLYKQVKKEYQGFGISYDGLPWEAMEVRERIRALRDLRQKAKAAYENEGSDVYEAKAQYIYGKLREAWERAVEEILLCKAIERLRPSIQTQRLRKATDITESDYKVIEDAMEKCSTFMAGHDEAPAINAPMPDEEEIKQDIEVLYDWVQSVETRRAKKPTAVAAGMTKVS